MSMSIYEGPVKNWPKSTDKNRYADRPGANCDPLGIFPSYGIAYDPAGEEKERAGRGTTTEMEDVPDFVAWAAESGRAADKDGWTPLHFAARNCLDRWQFERFIAEHGGVNARDLDDGFTPLHVAADNGNTIAIDALIAAGADVNAKDKDGYTPLHLACHTANRGSEVPVHQLINAGADVDAKKADGERPDDVARRCANHRAMLAIEAAKIHADTQRDGWVDVVRKHRESGK